MFGTWSVNNPNRSLPTFRHSPGIHQACRNCRAKKVKCTGESSGCQRCETLDIECTYTTGPNKRRRGSFAEKAKQDDQSSDRPAQDTKQLVASASRPRPPPSAATYISDMGIVEGTKASDGESSFAVDVEQWSLLSAFGSEAPSLTTDGSVCQSATSTNYSVDMAFWNDAFTIPPAAKTRNIVTTPQSRATLGGSSSTDPNTTSSQSQTENQPDPGPEIETETQTQANTRVERLAGGSGLTQWTEQKPCSCIQRIVLLINELETGINNMDDHDYNQAGGDGLLHNRRGLDSALGLHKETLHYGQSMRQCRQCSYRTETGLLLLLLVNRLVVLCANMVSTYLNASQSPVLSHELSITVGDYEVDSDVERGAVMREIVAFQLRALHSFIISLPDARHPPAADQIGAKNKVESLLQRLHMRSVAFPSP